MWTISPRLAESLSSSRKNHSNSNLNSSFKNRLQQFKNRLQYLKIRLQCLKNRLQCLKNRLQRLKNRLQHLNRFLVLTRCWTARARSAGRPTRPAWRWIRPVSASWWELEWKSAKWSLISRIWHWSPWRVGTTG